MNVVEGLFRSRSPRLVAGVAVAVSLTVGYGVFLYLHIVAPHASQSVDVPAGNKSDQTVRNYAIEFLQWTAAEPQPGVATNATPRASADPVAIALRRFLDLLHAGGRDQSAVQFHAPGLSATDNAVLTVLLREGPIARQRRISLFDLAVDWRTLPSITQDAFSSIEGASIGAFSAIAGTLRLNAIGAPILHPGYLNWLKQQDVGLLTDGFRPQGLKALESLDKAAGNRDPEIRGWLGAAITMQAIDAKSGIEKINYTEKGSAYLNQVVRTAPDNLTCRYIRSQTFLSLPSFFETQQKIAVKDLQEIYRWSKAGHLPTATDNDLKQVPVEVDKRYLGEVISNEITKNNLSPSVRESLKKLGRSINMGAGGAQ